MAWSFALEAELALIRLPTCWASSSTARAACILWVTEHVHASVLHLRVQQHQTHSSSVLQAERKLAAELAAKPVLLNTKAHSQAATQQLQAA